jgi:ATP-dependent DNA helicase RecQ
LQLKPEQENSLRALYSGKDTFVWLPTGFGKSLCYTALPFLYDSKLGRTASTSVSLTLVISPLVSLITDQVVDLRSKGVGSAVLTSESGRISRDLVASKQDLEKSSLLFCAPEALMECRWREILGAPAVSKRIVAVVIDEVHCVSKW